MTLHRRLAYAVIGMLASQLVACSANPEPAPAPAPEQHQELRRAIQEPIDKARAAEAQLQEQQKALQQQIDQAQEQAPPPTEP